MPDVYLPRTLNELWDLLQERPAATLYAGGTDVLVELRSGKRNASCLVCLERIDALRGVREEGDSVFIAAGTTHSELLSNPIVCLHLPVLTAALGVLGSPAIRHMATIGGNIVTASPAGDSLAPLWVLDAELAIRSHEASRTVPLSRFIEGPGRVNLRTGEILEGIRITKQQWDIQHYEKVGKRKAQACAVVSLAALLKLSDSGTIERVRLAWGSVGPTIVTSREVEQALLGRPLSHGTLREAAHVARQAVAPIDDIRASAAYRRLVAGSLLMRLL